MIEMEKRGKRTDKTTPTGTRSSSSDVRQTLLENERSPRSECINQILKWKRYHLRPYPTETSEIQKRVVPKPKDINDEIDLQKPHFFSVVVMVELTDLK